MKIPQKLEPYQRSRHRAALHAWVVAATAVASIGMPVSAALLGKAAEQAGVHDTQLSPALSAERIAADWLKALREGDLDAALSSTYLPADPENEAAIIADMQAVADQLAQSDAPPRPIAHHESGHWALSAWHVGEQQAIEPVTLYHPAMDGLSDEMADWRVVPIGYSHDPAFSPLYNADHDALLSWYRALD